MDVLSSMFSLVRLSSTIYFRSDFSAPWGMQASDGDFAQFHMVAAGKALITFEDGKEIKLNAGDMILLPHGTAHIISDQSRSRVIDGAQVVGAVQKGDSPFTIGSDTATLICGHFQFDKDLEHPFIKSLPRAIYISDLEHREASWFESVYNLIMNESQNGLAGSSVIMTRLAEIMLMHILRVYIRREQDNNPFYAAINDIQLSQSLSQIHNSPECQWSLVSLAKEAGMSRTLFATKFKSMVGTTPMEYLAQWRILKAKELLVKTHKPISLVAEQVGYSSEVSFNRAFKRLVNTTPLVFRKSA